MTSTRFLRHLANVLATGYILMFYSELMFWARLRPGDSLPNWIYTWLAYSLLGFVLLTLVVRFQIHSIWALFLAGSVFGWLAEGVIVQTAYESLPLSLSFTGLAWHALISVWVGWYALRRALHTSLRAALMLSVAVGLFYGLWAISWWIEPDGGAAPPAQFALYGLISTLSLILAYWIADRTQLPTLPPNRPLEILTAAAFLLYFVLVSVPAAPLALVIMPALLAIVYVTLHRSRQSEPGLPLLHAAPAPISAGRYLCLLVMPAAAAAFYTVAYALSLRWQTNWAVYLVTTPLGFILFGTSLVKIWRQPSVRLQKT